jgi:hypothetical protein
VLPPTLADSQATSTAKEQKINLLEGKMHRPGIEPGAGRINRSEV